MSEITWAELTEGERKILGNPKDTNYGAIESWNRLHDMGLIEQRAAYFGSEEGYRPYWSATDLGRAVLAEADAKPDSGATGAKNAQVEAGEEVEKSIVTAKLVGIIEVGLRPEASQSQYAVHILAQRLENTETRLANLLEVVDRLQAELSSAKAEADSEEHQGIHAMWLAERERNEALEADNIALIEQVARLRAALEEIANKADPEKPIRLDGETGHSYGRTYGQWEMSNLARKALQAK